MKNYLGVLISALFLFGSVAQASEIEKFLTAEAYAKDRLILAGGIRDGMFVAFMKIGDSKAKCVSEKTAPYLVGAAFQAYREMSPQLREDLDAEGNAIAAVSMIMAVSLVEDCSQDP